jgi:hypothetical protein
MKPSGMQHCKCLIENHIRRLPRLCVPAWCFLYLCPEIVVARQNDPSFERKPQSAAEQLRRFALDLCFGREGIQAPQPAEDGNIPEQNNYDFVAASGIDL